MGCRNWGGGICHPWIGHGRDGHGAAPIGRKDKDIGIGAHGAESSQRSEELRLGCF